jgi:ribosome modulation factor
MRRDLGSQTQIEVERSLVNSRKNHEYISHTVAVEADRVSILIDAREQGGEKAYLKFQGDYYFLEGINARSAQAVRAQLAGVLPENLLNGEIQVVLDVSRILANPKSDALYRYFDSNTAAALKISWEKQINRNTTAGVSGEIRNHRPYPLFQQRQTSLNSNRQGREQKWMAYVRIIF